MLCLQTETNPEWIEVANKNHDKILIDHAHCEKKATIFAISMINRYPERAKLVQEMIDLAKEEIEHFDSVQKELQKRGIKFTSDRGCEYAQKLHKLIRRDEPGRMLDFLITGALIEARSCERFSLLAKSATDETMRVLYKSLLASEAGHYTMYTDLAREYYPAAEVKARVNEMAALEADIVRNLKNLPSMHG
ncbi:MAG: tRNA-(ms[2]io[6]A)-hydroxylase [Bacteroidota bacterium]